MTFFEGWGRRDLNPYASRHKILSLARLPIPPLPRNCKIISVRGWCVNQCSSNVNLLLTGKITSFCTALTLSLDNALLPSTISKDWQKWMAELRSAIHFCPLLPAPARAGQRTTYYVKTLPVFGSIMAQSCRLEIILSRVINPDSAGKERIRLTKAVVLAIRELAKQNEPGENSRDLAAFIALALAYIAKTIEVSVAAWEKRDYWVKADKFRMEWIWSGQYAEKMTQAVLKDDWSSIAQIAAQTAQKLGKVNVPPKNRLGQPWVGAWEEFKKQKSQPLVLHK
jgi:hypothetical protein